MRNSVEGDLKDKRDEADKKSLSDAISETIAWLDASAEASIEEYQEKQKELEGIAKYVASFVFVSSSKRELTNLVHTARS